MPRTEIEPIPFEGQPDPRFVAPRERDEARERKPSKRFVYAWEKQAQVWREPRFHFDCCGTRYGAMTPEALEVVRQVHNMACHV